MLDDQADLAGGDVGDGAAVVGAAAVADSDAVAGPQAKHPGMCSVFASKRQKVFLNVTVRNKEFRQTDLLPSSHTYELYYIR